MNTTDARAYIQEAIDAISVGMTVTTASGRAIPLAGPESTIASELDRIDRAVGRKGHSLLAEMAEQVRQCAIALYAAKQALEEEPLHRSNKG